MTPLFPPGDPTLGDAIRGVAGKRSAVLFAHHGPVVAGKVGEAAVYPVDERREKPKLALLLRGADPTVLNQGQIGAVARAFEVEWDS